MLRRAIHNPFASSPREDRRGAAMVEAAICLPVVFLVVFGGIQVAQMIHLKQALTTAALVGSQQISRKGVTEAQIVATVESVLAQRNVQGATVAINGDVPFAAAPRGTYFTIVVRAPADPNLTIANFVNTQKNLRARITGMK